MKKNRIGARSGGRIFVRKWMMMMKFVFIFLICSLVQVQAAVYSQQSKVSVELKNVTLEKVFQELERQTGYSFLYNHRVIEVRGKVSVQVVDKELGVVLDDLLTKLGLGFTFDDNLVIIKEQPRIWGQDSVRKSLRIVGKVVDEKKLPMLGVTVKVVGLPVGTATNEKGRFAIELPLVKGTLEFSFVGFKKKIIEFSEKTAKDTLRIVMEEDVQALDETVVVAYGNTTKRKMTGAVSTIKADEIKGIPSVSIETLLQGRVAGMDITRMSGAPGGGGTAVTIRGYNSLDVEQGRRFSDPLWVVDGVPLNSFTSPITGTNLLSDLNPDMIESIQVLKDASSSAIYGSRAANGVIIVTTKKGKKNQHATLTVNASQTWSVLPKLPTITTGRAERLFRLRSFRDRFQAYIEPKTNRYKYPTTLREQYDNWGQDAMLDGNFIPMPDNVDNGNMFQDSLNAFYNNSTNYFPIYYERGKVTNANIQTYGGSERTTYGIGLGYYNEEGIFKGTGFNRVDLNSSINVIPVKCLNVDLRLNASLANRKRGTKTDMLGLAPPIETVPGDPYKLSSLLPGENSVAWNAVTDSYKKTKEKNRSVRLRTNFRLGYEPFDGLNITTSLAADYSIERRNYFQPSYLSYSGYSKSVGETGINLMMLNENILSFNRSIKEEHTINFVAGFSYQYDQEEYNGGSAENAPSDKIYYAPPGMPEIGYEGWGDYQEPIAFQHYRSDMQEKCLLSYFARLEYSYKERYLLSASIRRDGSSTFGENNRWGTFPSVALGWTFSEESFIKEKFEWLSFGKLRASWGRSGMHFTSNYLALGVMEVGKTSYRGNSTIEPIWYDGLYNNELSWEETDQYDFGIDMDFFNYRLNFTFDYYYRYTDELLARMNLPGDHNGYRQQWRNAAAISNEGIELMIKYEIFRQSDIYWKISINGARNWNRFEKSYNNKDFKGNIIGKSLNGVYARKTNGFIDTQDDVKVYYNRRGVSYYLPYSDDKRNIFYKPGDYKFIDVNGDGQANFDDEVYIGSALPKITGGIVNEFRWKNFDLNLLLTYMLGRHMVNSLEKRCLSSDLYYQALVVDLTKINFWEKPGDKPDYSRIQYDQFNGMWDTVDRDVEKVNYMKLKTLTLGYSFPKKWSRKVGMEELRIFVSGENLVTWTNYSGMDPETVNITSGDDWQQGYPLARKYTLGLTLKF